MNITVRIANKSNEYLLFKWTNDKDVRRNAFNKKNISYEEHMMWFDKILNSLNSHIYIYYLNDIPVGQLRIEVEELIGTISYSIDRNYRGLGLGTYILKNIDIILNRYGINVNKLIGKVLIDNIYSQNAFLKAEFEEKREVDYIEYFKYID